MSVRFIVRSMPRVSEEHLAARRRQILDAARACFMREGFHATSMQDVIKEANLSVGAVYRYFGSKNEIVKAIAEGVFVEVDRTLKALAEHEPALEVIEVAEHALNFIDAQTGPDGAFRMALPVWAEALRDPALGEFVAGKFTTIRGHFIKAARRAGVSNPEAAGAVLFGLIPAFGVQRVLSGQPSKETFLAGIKVLLN
jgi:AcrR family transcriptional regulator